MEYERIHKVQCMQMGAISPTKLRMKLLGAHNSRKKDGGSESSRTSPSKIEEMKNAKHSLLAADLNEEGISEYYKGSSSVQDYARTETCTVELSDKEVLNCSQSNQSVTLSKDLNCKEKGETTQVKIQTFPKNVSYQVQPSNNMSIVHPLRPSEGEGGHDNGGTSSFEFHRAQHPVIGSFSRNVPSKWNDAEKWIVNRQNMFPNVLKKSSSQSQGNRQMISNLVRIMSGSVTAEQRDPRDPVTLPCDTKRIDSIHPTAQILEKFAFIPHYSHSNLVSANQPGGSTVSSVGIDPESVQNFKDFNHREPPTMQKPIAETSVFPAEETVSMRDIGTQMTPIPSQEPSRTGTPLGVSTPSRSPISSTPSTPKRGRGASSPVNPSAADEPQYVKASRRELSEREMRLRTRREIAALGIRLGKMNIASWASKEELETASASPKFIDVDEQLEFEYKNRAAAWEEAEKSKHLARYKGKEVKIQAWEHYHKAKFEAEMKKAEARAERSRSRAQVKLAEKLAMIRQQAEEKQVAAEARMSRQAARTTQQAEGIRETGRIPSSRYLCCSRYTI